MLLFLRNLRSLYLWVSSAPISAEPRVFKLLGLIPLYCNELFKVSQCHALNITNHFQKTVIYSGAGISVSAGIGQAAKSGNGKMMGGAGTDAKYDD